jgi:hypothetical protein
MGNIKYLAAYLPYDVKVYIHGIDYTLTIEDENDTVGMMDVIECGHKLVLRPLSEVESDEEVTPEELQKCCYSYVEHLLSNHFDVFGMIPKGLAIDINTI